MRRSLALAATLAAAVAAPAHASLFGTAVGATDFTGTRSIGNGLTGAATYGTAFSISWTITQIGNQFRYSYDITVPQGRGTGLSHVLFSLSANCAEKSPTAPMPTSGCFYNPTYTGGVGVVEIKSNTQQQSNENLGNPIFGVKINTNGGLQGNVNITFFSERAPMWGDFYAKGGGNPTNTVENIGHDTPSMNKIDFVATPDTQTVVPEPSSMVLMGTGVLGLVAAARRRR
ncbi:MAG: PEP-CTERM sorting domain-containing protein [Gemmatimonadales bacterium]|nr:PEP-CTERM sorting domain-containing protein [Gemmatimonadales bacterium]